MNLPQQITDRLSEHDVALFEISGTPVTVATLITAGVVVVGAGIASWLVRRALRRLLRGREMADDGTIAAFLRLLHYSILAIGLCVALHTAGINLSALFAAGAIFAVAVGFAMQSIGENFVSGVILLLERSIKPEDVLEVEGQVVQVRKMGMRATVARTLDDEDLVIPNSKLVQSTVKNYTLRDRLYRLRTSVGVAYNSDLRQVRATLERVAADLSWRHPSKDPRILLSEFGDSAVLYDISVWIDDPWQHRQLRSKLNESVWYGLLDQGIVIAFPQLDLHLDEKALRALAGDGHDEARQGETA